MSGEPRGEDGTLVRRVPVIVRSWDGPNSRVGLEMDLGQMPWGPFDALGKRLSLLLPAAEDTVPGGVGSESQVERALRHVEHAADRCAEFSQLANGDQELWRRSQETWEWVRKYLTSLWVETEVEGRESPPPLVEGPSVSAQGPEPRPIPSLPGAASTLKVAARALRATPLTAWRETMGPFDPDDPTREEAVQTLLGVAHILSGQSEEGVGELAGSSSSQPTPSVGAQSSPEPDPVTESEPDSDQVSFDFATGYDEGYQMGRRVGLALGAKKRSRPGPSQG
jgi:hypothetical protein